MNDNQELILGGHSQGGGISVVASVDLKQYSPYVITFGAVRTLEDLCSDVIPERHFRFVNCAENSYDYWPMRFRKGGIHVGHAILLNPDAEIPTAYVGLNDNTNRSPSSWSVHKTRFSVDALSNLYSSSCNPLQITGWEDGHSCFSHEECGSGNCNTRKLCS